MLIKWRGRDPHGVFRMGQTRVANTAALHAWLDKCHGWQELLVAEANVEDWSKVIEERRPDGFWRYNA